MNTLDNMVLKKLDKMDASHTEYICHCKSDSNLPQNSAERLNDAVRTQMANVSQLVKAAKQTDYILPGFRLLTRVVCQIGPTWTVKMFEAVLGLNLRIFYYDLAWSLISEAEQTMDTLNTAAANVKARINVPIVTSMLFGVQDRARLVGRFANPARKEIILKKGAQFILSADRRILLRGTRVAMYCNCLGTLADLTPNTLVFIGATVVLRIQKVVKISIVCTVEVPGPVRAEDAVRLPISISDSIINLEGIEQIHYAIKENALAIVVKNSRTYSFHESLVKFINKYATKPLHIMTLSSSADVNSASQERFIGNTYDGIMHTVQHKYCPNLQDEPIELSVHELKLFRRLFDQGKPCYFMAHLDKENKYSPPMLDEKHTEVLHYLIDGYVLPTKADIDCHSLYRFLMYLHMRLPIDQSIARNILLNTPIEDKTRSGRRTIFRKAALASYSLKAKAIFMRTRTGRSATEMAQFRPACQVFAITDKMRLNMSLCKSLRSLYTGVMNVQVPANKADLNSWLLHQRVLFLNAILKDIRRRLLLHSDQIILLGKSGPGINYLNTFFTCTVAEFLAQSQQYYGLPDGEEEALANGCDVDILIKGCGRQ